MKHSEIEANARRPYVDKIKRDQVMMDSLANALRDALADGNFNVYGNKTRDAARALLIAFSKHR